MRTLTLVVLFLFAQQSSAPTVEPEVTKEVHVEPQPPITHIDITRKCPPGYEGHFVDPQPGINQFDEFIWSAGGGLSYAGGGQPAVAVCFEKSFWDKVAKNPDLNVVRYPPRPL